VFTSILMHGKDKVALHLIGNLKVKLSFQTFQAGNQFWRTHWRVTVDTNYRDRKWGMTVREINCVSMHFGENKITIRHNCIWRNSYMKPWFSCKQWNVSWKTIFHILRCNVTNLHFQNCFIVCVTKYFTDLLIQSCFFGVIVIQSFLIYGVWWVSSTISGFITFGFV
jgi:hypothetical protein